MAYLSLYRKYRPQTFSEILGQEHVANTLANAIKDDRVAHAYLFTGPRGTGKTSTARILAKALNCEHGPTPDPCGKCEACVAITEGSSLDVIEMDAASHSKVDETREILAGVPLAAARGRKKVYVIDEVHMLSAQAFNALLKTLEEPPQHVVFILATTEAHKVLPTIVSRTQRFDFRRVPSEAIEHHLQSVAKSEDIDVDGDAAALVARHADGSVRDALSVLDQLSNLPGTVGVSDVEAVLGERGEDAYIALFDAIASGDLATVFGAIGSLVAEGADMRQLAEGALGHARSLLLVHVSPGAEDLVDASENDRVRLIEQAQRFTPSMLLRTIDLIWKAYVEMRNAPNHRLLLEIALVRAASPDTDPSATGLLGRIERLERRMGIDSQEQPPQEPKAAMSPPAKAAMPPPQPQTPQSQAVRRPPRRQQPTPEQAPVQTPPKTEPAGVPPEVGLGHIKEAWPATLQEVSRRSKTVWALLNPSSPHVFDEETLQIEVMSDFHENEMKQERNRGVLGEALHAALGISPRLAFKARAKEAPRGAPPQEDISALEESEVADHDPVELVKKDFAAEVVEETAER